MYKRERRQHFNDRMREMEAEHRLTANQKEWEEEAYKLNNRLAEAEKRGFRFEDNIIPERPSRVTKADIEYLKQINRRNLENYASSYEYDTEPEEATDLYFEEPQDDFLYPDRSESELPEYEYEDDEEDDEEQDSLWWNSDDDGEYNDTYEPEPYNPQGDYYSDSDRDYDNELPPTEGYTVIENIRAMFGRQSYEIETSKWATDENLRIKYDAAAKIFDALNTAIHELGEDAVARGIQEKGAQEINKAAEIALFVMYRDEVYTQRITLDNMNPVIDAFFAVDPSSKMSWDFDNDEEDIDI